MFGDTAPRTDYGVRGFFGMRRACGRGLERIDRGGVGTARPPPTAESCGTRFTFLELPQWESIKRATIGATRMARDVRACGALD